MRFDFDQLAQISRKSLCDIAAAAGLPSAWAAAGMLLTVAALVLVLHRPRRRATLMPSGEAAQRIGSANCARRRLGLAQRVQPPVG